MTYRDKGSKIVKTILGMVGSMEAMAIGCLEEMNVRSAGLI